MQLNKKKKKEEEQKETCFEIALYGYFFKNIFLFPSLDYFFFRNLSWLQ